MPLRLSGSTGVSGIDGTAQAPAVQGTNPNAGIYYSGNNVIVSTSGNTALTVGPSGNVAISNSFSISGQYVTPYSGMMKNRIINGDFKIDQRFAGAANTNTSGMTQYVVDRWLHTCNNLTGKIRFQRNNTNGPSSSSTQNATGFSYYFGCNVVSSNATVGAGDYCILAQSIEGLNISDLGWGTANASPVTLSFWTYSSIAGTHGGTINSGGDTTAYPFTYSINTANTWEYKTITIPGPTSGTFPVDNSTGVTVYFVAGAIGSTYTRSNTFTWGATPTGWPTGAVNIVTSANGSLYFTGVQLEKGSQATAFDFRHYTTELQLCHRYYENTAYPDTGFGLNQMRVSICLTSTSYSSGFNYLVPKRTSPAVTLYSRSGNPGKVSLVTTGGEVSGTSTATNLNATGFWGIALGAAQTAGAGIECGWTASAELGVQN